MTARDRVIIRAMARYAGKHVSSGDPVRDAAEAAEVLRDRLTREWLEIAVSDRHADIVGFDPRWWDGDAYERCLVITAEGQRMRVIEAGGEAVVIPFERRAAGQTLAGRRQPRPAELTVPAPRAGAVISIDVRDDVVRCPADGCGALRSVERVEPCPRCGAEPIDG